MPIDPALAPAPIGPDGAYTASKIADLERRLGALERSRGIVISQFQIGYSIGLVPFGTILPVGQGRLWIIGVNAMFFSAGTAAANTVMGFDILANGVYSGQAYAYADGTPQNPQIRPNATNMYALPGTVSFTPNNPTNISSGSLTGLVIEVPWDLT